MNLPFLTTRTASLRSSDLSGRDRVVLVGMLLGPAMLAGAWSVLMPAGGPSSAFAGQDPMANAVAQAKVRKATDEEKDATRYGVALCSDMPEFESPTLIPDVGSEDEGPTVNVDEGEPVAPEIHVASIMRDASGNPAVYADGQLFKQGDEIGDGWVIESIDLRSRTLTIAHPASEQTLTLAPGR